MTDFIAENAAFYFWLGVSTTVFGLICVSIGLHFLGKANEYLALSQERLEEAMELRSQDARGAA